MKHAFCYQTKEEKMEMKNEELVQYLGPSPWLSTYAATIAHYFKFMIG